MKRIVLVVLCLGLIIGGFAQQYINPKRILTPKQMKIDATYYFYEMERTHFCPHCVLGDKEYKRAKKGIFKQITKPMAMWEFALLIGSTNSWFDGHSVVGYIYPLIYHLQEEAQCVFYDIIVKDGCFFFENWMGIPDSLKGKRIVSINGVSDVDIYDTLSRYSSKESLAYLNHRLTMYFPYLYPAIYGITEKFDIIYHDDDDMRRVVLSKENINEWHNTSNENRQEKDNNKSLYCKFYPDDKIAIFELNSFACYGESLNTFINDLNCSFDSLRNNGYKRLFLDVTRNGGGTSECVDAVLDNLNVPDSLITFTALKKSETIGEVDTLYAIFRKERGVYYDELVYLLQSKSTYSAAVNLCSSFKAINLGCVIGEETGGLTAGYIDYKEYVMPYSSVEFSSSFKKYKNIGGSLDGRGVLPDIEYPTSEMNRSFTLDELKQFIEMCENK